MNVHQFCVKIPIITKKNRNKIKKCFITCCHIWHVNIAKYVYWLDTKSVKVWWRYNTSDMNARQLCMKIPKKRNKIKGRSITCGHIWHVNTSKCVYWLDTHYVNVWWSYMLPNTNAIHFYDIFSDLGECFWLAQIKSHENQKSGHIIW